MNAYGPEPPWRRETHYGWWKWVPPSADDWFGDPGHWELQPPRTTSERMRLVLTELYAPSLRDFLNSPVLFPYMLGDGEVA